MRQMIATTPGVVCNLHEGAYHIGIPGSGDFCTILDRYLGVAFSVLSILLCF